MLKIFHNSDFLHNASASLHDRVKDEKREGNAHGKVRYIKCKNCTLQAFQTQTVNLKLGLQRYLHFAKVYVYCISSAQDRFFLVLAAVSPTAEKYK